MTEFAKQLKLTRRGFLATSAVAAGAAMSGSLTALAAFDDDDHATEGETIFSSNCRSNCMGACRLLLHVRDNKLVKIEPGTFPDDRYRGCCLKGLSYIERIYNPKRILHPMKRVGERGADQWEVVSWDDAIKEISEKFLDIAAKYGSKAIIFDTASGSYGMLQGLYSLYARLGGCIGPNGVTKTVACYDYALGYGVNRITGCGDWAYCNEPASVLDSSMIIVWGTNPVFCQPQNWRWIQWAKEKGAKTICIDPIKSATAHRCDEWIYVNPGHDGYLALAMCNYLIHKGMLNEKYLLEKTTGAFLVRKDTGAHLRLSNWGSEEAPAKDEFYVWDNAANKPVLRSEAVDPALEGHFVTEDGVEVSTAYSLLETELTQYTISEASRLTGMAEDRIVALAESFATERAISVNITYGLDHYVNGYTTAWCVAMLLSLTGQISRKGAGFVGVFTQTWSPALSTYWFYTPGFKGYNANVPFVRVPEMFETQKLEGKDYPTKAMLSYSSNPMSNSMAQKQFMEKIFPNMEYWVVIDTEMTDSARHADMVLPCASWYEKEDLRYAYNNPYIMLCEKAIDPLGESKSDMEIAHLIGRGMGLDADFAEANDNNVSYYYALLFSDALSKSFGLSEAALRENKVMSFTGLPVGEYWIRGVHAPWPTETGLLQLYSEKPTPRLNYGQDLSDRTADEHIVYYREPDEAGVDNPLKEKYPLVFLQEHARFRTHSQWFQVPTLRELDPEPVAKINSIDAAARGVKNNDYIEVFNDRGHAVVRARIDESISPGILSIPKGWQRDQYKEGCYQEMTNSKTDKYPDAVSPYDSRVDFKKWEE